MHSPSLQSSIHRMLALRIALTALLVGAVFAGLAWATGQSRVEERALELARNQTTRFNESAMPLLNQGSAIQSGELQAAAEAFSTQRGGIRLTDGYFVLARIYDLDGGQLVNLEDPQFADMDVVRRAMDQARVEALSPDEYRVVSVNLEGSPYVGVAVPLVDAEAKVVAQMMAAFAVSDQAMTRIREGTTRTILYVLGIVLLTAVALYPIISGLMGRLARLASDLLDANLETMQVLGGAIAKRDSDTDAHNYRVSVSSVSRAEIQSLIKGALLHDVGKLGIRDDVLLKPGKLDAEEFRIMKTHVEHGLDITSRASWLTDAQPVVGGHHEKYDGSGYPRGLAGSEIPVNARIFAIADVFDALTSKRPYKEPMEFAEAMEILEAGRESHFDPDLLDAFQRIAPQLHREYGGRDDDAPRQRLEAITQDYFMTGVSSLLA